MDFKYILKTIKQKGCKEVVIYPYGEYGEKLDKNLSDTDVRVKYKVDNCKCDDSLGIINGQELKRIYAGEYVVLSTTSLLWKIFFLN